MNRRRFTGAVLALAGGLGAALYGCGGGGGDSVPQGNDAVRAIAIGAHQSFAGGRAYPFAAIRLAAPTGSQFTTRAVQLGRDVPAGLVYDPTLNVYKKYTPTGNTVSVTYYSDAAGTIPVGSASVAQPGVSAFSNDYATYPATVNFSADTSGGTIPFNGSGSVVFNDASGANTLSGRFTSRQNNTTLEGTMTLSNAGNVGGSMTMTQGGTTTRFTNVTGMLGSDLEGDVACEPYGWTGRARFNLFTGAFSITLNTDTGAASATRNDAGDLVIQFADGTTQTIANPLQVFLDGSGGGGTPTPVPTPTPTPTPTPVPTNGDYTVTELGPTGGQLRFAGRNASGHSIASEGTTASAKGYVFSSTGAKTQLPTLAGYTGNIPMGISDDGRVVGTCYRAASPTEAGYVYNVSTGAITSIPEMRIARGVSNGGKVVGQNLSLQLMVFDLTTSTPTLPTGATGFSPYAINDNGYIIGTTNNGVVQLGAVYNLATSALTPILLGDGKNNNPAFELTSNNLVGGVTWNGTSGGGSDEVAYLYNIGTGVLTVVPTGQNNVYVSGETPSLAVSNTGLLAALDNQAGYLYYNGQNRKFDDAIGTTNANAWGIKWPIGFAADGTLLAQAFRKSDSTWQLVRLTPR